MNLSICLDQYASNFDVNNLSTNGFNVYTNLDLTNPLVQGIPYQNLFSPPLGNCPYLLTNIPAGVTQIYVADNCISNPEDPSSTIPTFEELVITCCYAIIDVPQTPPTTSSFCTTCSLDFDVFSSSYVGQIVAGNLTSTCGPVTDYTIGWYLDGDYSSPIFISGTGSAFLPYQHSHPLTGNYSVPVLAGDWEGIIHDIAINGVIYSSVSGSANGQPIPFESCFDTVVVDPLTCANGPYSATSKYSHKFTFNSQAVGTTPAPVSLTYALNSTTKYFAYGFNAYNVWDELEIKWKSGNPSATPNPSLYSQPIYLEKIKAGSDISSANLPITTNTSINNTWPKQYQQSNAANYLKRVLTLTTLPTSSNPSFPDLLEITITPNPSNNNTQWQAGFQCLDDFDCTDCAFDNYPDSLPKISKIELNKQYTCDAQQIQLSISGCLSPNSDFMGFPFDPFVSLTGSLVASYNEIFVYPNQPGSPGIIDRYFPGISSPLFLALKPSITCVSPSSANITCGPASTGTITLNKSLGQIQFIFSLEADYLHYKNSLINRYNFLSALNGTNITSPISCPAGSTSTNYYRLFRLSVPIQNSSTANCGDNTSPFFAKFHINDYFNVVYVENPSTNTWSITIPQTPMVNCYPSTEACSNCYSNINSFVNSYNSEANNPQTYTFTTNVGAKYLDPFGGASYVNRIISSSPSGSTCMEPLYLEQGYFEYSITTMPFISSSQSPTGWVNLSTLSSSIPCDTTPYIQANNFPGLQLYRRGTIGGYQVRFPNLTSSFNYTTSTNDFEIYAFAGFGITGSKNVTPNTFPLPCPDPSGSKIYSYIGGVGTVYTSSYFVGGSPTLIIDP
jgi:hypothetical protein